MINEMLAKGVLNILLIAAMAYFRVMWRTY